MSLITDEFLKGGGWGGSKYRTRSPTLFFLLCRAGGAQTHLQQSFSETGLRNLALLSFKGSQFLQWNKSLLLWLLNATCSQGWKTSILGLKIWIKMRIAGDINNAKKKIWFFGWLLFTLSCTWVEEQTPNSALFRWILRLGNEDFCPEWSRLGDQVPSLLKPSSSAGVWSHTMKFHPEASSVPRPQSVGRAGLRELCCQPEAGAPSPVEGICSPGTVSCVPMSPQLLLLLWVQQSSNGDL